MPPERPRLGQGTAILIGAALIALSITFIFRWTLVPTSNVVGAFRLDRWTGELVWCFPPLGTGHNIVDCSRR